MSQQTEHRIRYGHRAASLAKAAAPWAVTWAVHYVALWLCACTFFAAALFSQVPYNLPLPNMTVTSGTPVDQAGNSVTADSNFTVNGSANVTFIAGSSIHLGPGFHATAGSAAITFDARIAPPPVPSITTTSLPNGTVNTAYTQSLGAAGGVQSYTWSLANGTMLPPGLNLNSVTGVLSGTPNTAGPYNFTVMVTDYISQLATKQFGLTIAASSPDFTISLPQSSQTGFAGGSVAYTVNTTALNGFNGTQTFSLSGLPSGFSGTFSPPTVAGAGSTQLTLNIPLGTAPGTTGFTITGTSGSLVHNASASVVTANSAPSALSVNPNTGNGSAQTFAFAFSDPGGVCACPLA